jgi:hypothetical protein
MNGKHRRGLRRSMETHIDGRELEMVASASLCQVWRAIGGSNHHTETRVTRLREMVLDDFQRRSSCQYLGPMESQMGTRLVPQVW